MKVPVRGADAPVDQDSGRPIAPRGSACELQSTGQPDWR